MRTNHGSICKLTSRQSCPDKFLDLNFKTENLWGKQRTTIVRNRNNHQLRFILLGQLCFMVLCDKIRGTAFPFSGKVCMQVKGLEMNAF